MTPSQAASRYAASRYLDGADGKSLLVGWSGDRALFALAAGIADARQEDHFARLARYLLRRDRADGYWLVLPADLGGMEQLVLELVHAGTRRLSAVPVERGQGGGFSALGAEGELGLAPPLGDLFADGGTLAGIQRRELDGVAERLAVPLP